MQQLIQMANTKTTRNQDASSKRDKSVENNQQTQRMSINQMSSKNSSSIPMWKISEVKKNRIMATEADEFKYTTNKNGCETKTPPEQMMSFKLI